MATTPKTPTRVYLVQIGGSTRLIRANHPTRALMHAARRVAVARVATQDDLIAHVGRTAIEDAHGDGEPDDGQSGDLLAEQQGPRDDGQAGS
jgi:hypothetical protein